MRVGICDFPSAYAFPPYGYGGIERWLWAVAVGARRSGAEVYLIGPGWRHDLPEEFARLDLRLEDQQCLASDLSRFARLRLDLLVVGHEYPSLPAWRAAWRTLDCDVVTFQHDPNFRHLPDAFDGERSRLFCYSAEMMRRYAQHLPRQCVSVQFGRGEEDPPRARHGRDLLWLGRIDHDKAPHLAIRAAQLLGRRLLLAGPVLDTEYAAANRRLLMAPHVVLLGEVAGRRKLNLLREAAVLVYSCGRDYVEAGAAVFGESLRSGTPVAALVWRGDTCAETALCADTGCIALAPPVSDDDATARRLAMAISAAEGLDRDRVQDIGSRRFDPVDHFRTLAEGSCRT